MEEQRIRFKKPVDFDKTLYVFFYIPDAEIVVSAPRNKFHLNNGNTFMIVTNKPLLKLSPPYESVLCQNNISLTNIVGKGMMIQTQTITEKVCTNNLFLKSTIRDHSSKHLDNDRK